jgi:hypothetical protein
MYKYEDFDNYTLEESLDILINESERNYVDNTDLINDIMDELKKQDESVATCNRLIQQIVDRLNEVL